MVTNCESNALDLVRDVYDSFDGLVFVDGKSSDKTKEVLEKYKKDGQILTAEWCNSHGWSMMGILNSDKILYGDWCLYSDDSERINPIFAQNIRLFIDKLESQNINTVYLYGKILMHKYFSNQVWEMVTPHCYLKNARPNAIDLSQFEDWKDERKSRYNVRPERRPKDHAIAHFFKYLLYKSNNNQLLCGRESDQEGYQKHEQRRQEFIIYICRVLNLPLKVDSIKDYLLANGLDEFLLNYVNFEPIFNHFYAYYIQKRDLDEVLGCMRDKKMFEIV